MATTREDSCDLGSPLSVLPHDSDEGARLAARLFAESDVDARTEMLDAALELFIAALPEDLCGYSFWRPTGGAVTRLTGSSETTGAWALADALRSAARQQLPVSAVDEDGIQLAVPCGPGAALGVRRTGGRLALRESLLVQSIASASLLASPDSMPIRWR